MKNLREEHFGSQTLLMLGRLEGKVDALLAAKVSRDEKIGEIEKRLQGL